MGFIVNNAVIMAAGTSSRFAPISYEIPKALISVRGEVLIERQIKQLIEAGIDEIIVVVGYKKEKFYYLKDKLNVIIVENNEYDTRNNHSSIYAVRNYLKNTYICSADNYFTVNPFEKEVDSPYYSAVYANGNTNEWCMDVDSEGYINNVSIGGSNSWYMLGHALWNENFSKKFIDILTNEYDIPETKDLLWESIYKNHLDELKLKMKKYSSDVIFEFDSLDELREFDEEYIENTGSKIIADIASKLNCSQGNIKNIIPIKDIYGNDAVGFKFCFNNQDFEYIYKENECKKIYFIKKKGDLKIIEDLSLKVLNKSNFVSIERMGGLTNRTYKVIFSIDEMYVFRIPGEGTKELIVRADEQKSTELACNLGIDAELLYFDLEGYKVTKYIKNAVTMSPESMRKKENIKKAAEVLYNLHNSGVNTGVPFEVFDMAMGYENIIVENNVGFYDDYEFVKNKVFSIKEHIDKFNDIAKVPCHNDALCENWIASDDRMHLIDWEYAGMNDAFWDLADVSIEASFDHDLDEFMLREYLKKRPATQEWKRFMANKLYVDYLWMLWARTRIPYNKDEMEVWALERYSRLKDNLVKFEKI